MKILMCIDGLFKDGASRVFLNLAEYLNTNYKVIVCCTTNNKKEYEVPKNIKIVNSFSTKRIKIMRIIYRIINLNKIIRIEKPSLIISFLPMSSYITALLKTKKYKLIISVRNDPANEYKKIISHFLMKKLYIKADGFVFQTPDAKKYFENIFPNKGIIILNPLSENFLLESKQLFKKENIIVNIGRLTEQKNQILLIDSFKCIFQKYPNYKLYIYGDGPMYNEISIHIKKIKMENQVFLKGITDNIRNELEKAYLFVLSSNYEGLPNSLMEAMSLGIPCISTDCPCGGPRLLINNMSNGILVNVNNREELTNAIEKVIVDENLANLLGKNAKKIKRIVYPNKIYKEWNNYIKKIVN